MSHANSFKRLVVKDCILIRKYDSVSNDIYSGALAREARQRSTMGKKMW